jgi:hypothetical protein
VSGCRIYGSGSVLKSSRMYRVGLGDSSSIRMTLITRNRFMSKTENRNKVIICAVMGVRQREKACKTI